MDRRTNLKERERLRKLEGLQTVQTTQEILGFSRQATINYLSKLKKEHHATVKGGGKRIRLYTITMRKQLPRRQGMFDIINKYSPHMKINPWYDHQVHGPYGPEEALVDAIGTQSFRVTIAALNLFKHILDWKKLYKLAKEKGCWQQVGAMYDVAKTQERVRHMPKTYHPKVFRQKKYIIKSYTTPYKPFKWIEQRWNVGIPYNIADLEKLHA